MLDFAGGELNKGKSLAKDSDLSKAMFEGSQQFRKKLKFPDSSSVPDKYREDAEDMAFSEFSADDEIGRFFFCRFVADICPVQGNFLLRCLQYKTANLGKREIAEDVVGQFVETVSQVRSFCSRIWVWPSSWGAAWTPQVWSGPDADDQLEAYGAGGRASVQSGKQSGRQKTKAKRVDEAQKLQVETTAAMSKLRPDLLSEMFLFMSDDVDTFWGAFKHSKYMGAAVQTLTEPLLRTLFVCTGYLARVLGHKQDTCSCCSPPSTHRQVLPGTVHGDTDRHGRGLPLGAVLFISVSLTCNACPCPCTQMTNME